MKLISVVSNYSRGSDQPKTKKTVWINPDHIVQVHGDDSCTKIVMAQGPEVTDTVRNVETFVKMLEELEPSRSEDMRKLIDTVKAQAKA